MHDIRLELFYYEIYTPYLMKNIGDPERPTTYRSKGRQPITLITIHTRLLHSIHHRPALPLAERAAELGITERTVNNVLRDLGESNLIHLVARKIPKRYGINYEANVDGVNVGKIIAFVSESLNDSN